MGRKARRSDSQVGRKKGIDPTVLVALITAISAIVIALINSQTIIGWLVRPTLTPTIISSPVPIFTDTLVLVATTLVSTNTIEATLTPTSTAPSTTLPSITETPSLPIGMHVRLYADRTTGKASLTVKLDARDSFLRAPGGEIYGCRGGACVYTWEVYSGGQKIGKPEDNSTGTYQYTFGRKGTYFITVWVCRGGGSSDCNGSGAQIIVN